MNIRNRTFGIVISCLAMTMFIIYSCVGHGKERKPKIKISSYSIEKIQDKENCVPVVIIGSGPAGLSAATYAARANLKTVVIQGDKPGGLLTETSNVENWPGKSPTSGIKLMDDARAQAESFGAELLYDTVNRVDFSQWPFVIYTEDGKKCNALAVIIATGAKPRMLGVSGEKDYWTRGVSSCAVCDAPFYKDCKVVVVGGGDSAIEEALQLAQFAKGVTILVRKDYMRAASSMRDQLSRFSSINVVHNIEVQQVLGDGEKVTGVELLNSKTKERYEMPIDGLFLAIGHDPSSTLFEDFIAIDNDGYIKLHDRSQATSLPGVFVAGDVADSKYRQAGVAAGDGIKAALDAIEFLNKIGFKADVILSKPECVSDIIKDVKVSIPVLVTNDDFEREVAASKEPVVVDFFAHYCPPCMAMLPVFESVAHSYEGKVKFVKVDTEISGDLAQRFFIKKIPCLLVFKDGQMVARYNGAMNKEELEAFVDQFIESPGL